MYGPALSTRSHARLVSAELLTRCSIPVAVCVAALLYLAASATAQSTPPEPTLEQQVAKVAAAHHGGVTLYAENLKTGQTVGLEPDRPVQTASVIKLTILFDAMEQVRQGRVTLADPIILKKADQVAGSGVLQLLDTPITLTLNDVLTLMITQSDNTATNLAIDRLGLKNINAETQALGLHNTWLYKKVQLPATEPVPADQKIYGLGKTTAREMTMLLSRIDRCQFVTPIAHSDEVDRPLCTAMLAMLQKQFYRDAIPRYLEQSDSSEVDASLGNKSGSLDAVRNDVGIVSTKNGTVLLSVFTYNNKDQSWSVENEGERTIAEIAKIIVNAWAPAGLDPSGYHPAMTSAAIKP